MKLKTDCIIYVVRNVVVDKVYVGYSERILLLRKHEHLANFKEGLRCSKLYVAMQEYGVENFVFEIICNALDKRYLRELELHFIKCLDSIDNGYNTVYDENPSHLPEVKAKISAKLTGREITWKDKIWQNRKQTTYKVTFPDNHTEIITGVRQYCRDHNLNVMDIYNAADIGRKSSKGFIVTRLNDYPAREYTQASGSAEHPEKDDDIV